MQQGHVWSCLVTDPASPALLIRNHWVEPTEEEVATETVDGCSADGPTVSPGTDVSS